MTTKEKRNIYLRAWRKTDVCKNYQRKYQKEYYKNNKEKVKGYQEKFRKNNRDKVLKGYKDYYLKNSERRKKYAKGYRINNLEKCKNADKSHYLRNKEKHVEYRKKYQEMNSEKLNKYRTKYRLEAMSILGKICVKCGFNDLRALSIDHINGGGDKDRREVDKQIYRWLRKNNYPEGYQTLCMNCQFIKRAENKEWRGRYPSLSLCETTTTIG